MANRNLFISIPGKLLPHADVLNREGAPAYGLEPKHRLAQYAVTGCLNGTFYAGAGEQLATVLGLCAEVDGAFIAKTAVYCRRRGYMKDMPALLCAVLSKRAPEYLAPVFAKVIDNGRMLRNFVQIMRSGAVGRKSLGTRPKRLVQKWLERASDPQLIEASVGQAPSLADIIRMVHPKPADATREALYGYFVGRQYRAELLPEALARFECYKHDASVGLPAVPFQMLTALELRTEDWAQIARNAGWHALRMNLNTFARHGVFGVQGMAGLIAARLRDRGEIERARAFPYQLLAAYAAAGEGVPAQVREALQDAMEVAIGNVPEIAGKVYVCPDVSGSMASPATGFRKGAASAVRCIDVAALVAAAVLRKNPGAEVIPFEDKVRQIPLNRRDSVMTNAAKLAAIGGGGTNCSAPLALLNARKASGELVVLVSDNQSWVDARAHGATQTQRQWEVFKQRNPRAKLVCIDIQPYGSTQAAEREDVLNVGGFADEVFNIVASFASGQMHPAHWVGVIEGVEL
jgi:60 kDa SS-A/Ro ribonucleoprotein